MKTLLYKPVFHILLIVMLGILAYSNTFHVPFHFDDRINIVENVKLGDFNNFWPPSGTRWFGDLTFAINYRFGGLDVTGYHIVNLAIHVFNAMLVYWLVVLTFRIPFSEFRSQNSGVRIQNNTDANSPIHHLLLPFFSALIFVSHPIQTQAVTYLVQRFTSLATFFYLLSLVMYVKFRMQESGIRCQVSDNREQNKTLNLKPKTWYLCSLISAILAMKTKEISFTLPFIITLYEFSFFSKTMNHELRTINLKRFLYLLPFLLTLLIIPLSMSGINKPLGDVISELKEYTAETDAIDRWSYLFTQFSVIVTYLRLLVLPINQNLLYAYPVYRSFLNPEVFLSFLFLLSIFGLGVYLFYRSRFTSLRAEQAPPLQNSTRYTLNAARFLSFGIFWFFITLAVESSIIPIRHLIFEHRLYLPSVGAIIAFVSATFYILQFIATRLTSHTSRFSYLLLPTYYCLLSTIIITLSMATYQRNSIWRDEIILWKDIVEKSPDGANSHNGLGTAYYRRGMMDEAINEYHKALSLDPNHKDAQYNLSLVYAMKKAIDSKKKVKKSD